MFCNFRVADLLRYTNTSHTTWQPCTFLQTTAAGGRKIRTPREEKPKGLKVVNAGLPESAGLLLACPFHLTTSGRVHC